MSEPEPILPDYHGPNLSGLLGALLAPPGRRAAWLPEPASTAEQVVLLVLDGLGWLQLAERGDLAPAMTAMTGGPITSVVPSTTATALTSITVGVPPAVHGVVGYKVAVPTPNGLEVMNVLRWRTPSGDARSLVDPEAFQPLPPFGGVPVPVVSKVDFDGTGFTIAHQRGAELASWVQPSGLSVEVRRLVGEGAPFVYAYYEGIDKVAHLRGFGEHYDAELEAVDAMVSGLLDRLPSKAAVVVTADHGQVEVGERAVPLDARLYEEVALASGEARFRWLHAPPGSPDGADRLAKAARETYGEEAWVLTREEAETAGWFGGPLSEAARSRLGDVALVPHRPVGYLAPSEEDDPPLACRHGSLTPEEMLVPLLAGRGRLGR